MLATAGHFIAHVKDPDCELQEIAVSSSIYALEKIDGPCEAAVVASVRRYGAAQLMSVKGRELTTAMVEAAIDANPRQACEMFSDLPLDLQRHALRRDPRVLDIIRRYPSYDPRIAAEIEARADA